MGHKASCMKVSKAAAPTPPPRGSNKQCRQDRPTLLTGTPAKKPEIQKQCQEQSNTGTENVRAGYQHVAANQTAGAVHVQSTPGQIGQCSVGSHVTVCNAPVNNTPIVSHVTVCNAPLDRTPVDSANNQQRDRFKDSYGQRLYSMAELLALQDLELMHTQPSHQASDDVRRRQMVEQARPAQDVVQVQDISLDVCGASTASGQARQQQANSYALQQGLQIAAQSQQRKSSPQAATVAKSRFQELTNTVPLAAGVERLDPKVVYELLRRGQCVLVDLRGDDRVCGTIEGAVNIKAIDTVPFADRAPELVSLWRNQPLIIFHCQYSCHRAPQCANWYKEKTAGSQRVAIMDGGFRGWESTGLPVVQDATNQLQRSTNVQNFKGMHTTCQVPHSEARHMSGRRE